MWTFSHVLDALGLYANIEETKFDHTPINGFSFNSQTLKEGQAFIALRGKTQDGHLYLDPAWKNGARLLIAEKDMASFVPKKASHILVPSTYEALNCLGAWAREQASQTKIVAITGSAGKTTTKDWLKELLSTVDTTVASAESYNNYTGVPISLTELINKPAYGVFEVGTNHPGEIRPLVRLIRPHACIITTVAPAHVGNFGSVEAIAEEKASILQGLVPGGIAILPYDSPYFERLKRTNIQTISFGSLNGADIRLVSYTENQGSAHIEVDIFGRRVGHTLPFIGLHYASNVLAILALAHHWGLPDLPFHTLQLSSQRGRVSTCKIASGVTVRVVDDSYNANPASMEAGLQVLAGLPCDGRRIAVLGEMLELGEHSADAHRAILPQLRAAGVDQLFVVGEGCLPLVEAWNDHTTCTHVEKAHDLLSCLISNIQHGDTLFIKGSKASGVHGLMEWLCRDDAA